MNLIVILFYEQSGLEELEVELQVCRAPSIELALKETRTILCLNVTKCRWNQNLSANRIVGDKRHTGRDDASERKPSKKYVQSKEDR